jgi:hypothetical protein
MSNVLSAALICLHIVYDFVKSNGIFILLPPCSRVVDGCQHQQLVVVCLFVFFLLAILLHVLLRFAAFNYHVW